MVTAEEPDLLGTFDSRNGITTGTGGGGEPSGRFSLHPHTRDSFVHIVETIGVEIVIDDSCDQGRQIRAGPKIQRDQTGTNRVGHRWSDDNIGSHCIGDRRSHPGLSTVHHTDSHFAECSIMVAVPMPRRSLNTSVSQPPVHFEAGVTFERRLRVGIDALATGAERISRSQKA